MSDELSDLGEIRLVGAIVVRGTPRALDRFIRETRAHADLETIYVRTGAGKLRIVEEMRP